MSNISLFSHTDNVNNESWNIYTYSVYFKSKKELIYIRLVDPNILGASRHVHSDLRIYRISFFLLDVMQYHATRRNATQRNATQRNATQRNAAQLNTI